MSAATSQLARYEAARRALASARTLAQINPIRFEAAALREYARQAKDKELEVHAVELRIRAERRVGEVMRQQKETVGLAKPPGSNQHRGKSSPDALPTLAEAGIDKDLAKRARKLAAIPSETFEALVADWRAASWHAGDRLSIDLIRSAADLGKHAKAVTPSLPTDVYRTIVIDPPWPMKKSLLVGEPEQGRRLDYPTLSLDELTPLVKGLAQQAAPDAHLYLWVTHRFLPAGLELVETCGFTYHCVLTWFKPGGFTPFSWQLNTEHVLFAYKGEFHLDQMGLKVGFTAPRAGHSVKPEVFYDLVERASPAPRLECFGRTDRAGWHVWGDEVCRSPTTNTRSAS